MINRRGKQENCISAVQNNVNVPDYIQIIVLFLFIHGSLYLLRSQTIYSNIAIARKFILLVQPVTTRRHMQLVQQAKKVGS